MCHVPVVSHLVLIIFSVSLKYSKYCARFEVLKRFKHLGYDTMSLVNIY